MFLKRTLQFRICFLQSIAGGEMLTDALGRVVVYKENPYHDATGAFTSKDKAVSGAGVEQKPAQPYRSKIVPSQDNAEARQRLTSYMEGFYKNLKNENERKYVAERCRQMVGGEVRPKGMSGKFGLEKRRAIQYEMLTYKIFQSGRAKIGI